MTSAKLILQTCAAQTQTVSTQTGATRASAQMVALEIHGNVKHVVMSPHQKQTIVRQRKTALKGTG